jgi:23S rRNA pseudouridine2604 synthase
MTMRLNKFLSEAGVCSRREADALIEQGLVKVDGVVAALGTPVSAGQKVELRGRAVKPPHRKYYLLFNKPVGVITTTDANSRDNIMEAIRAAGWPLDQRRVVPVGRLDVASGGLILLTSDTDAADRMLRAEGEHEKEYLVTVDRTLTERDAQALRDGVVIMGRKTLPAKVRQLKDDHFSITLVQGMNRQIRRMCEALGYEVVSLKRVRIMHLHIDKMQPGEYRELTPAEVKELRIAVGLESPRPSLASLRTVRGEGRTAGEGSRKLKPRGGRRPVGRGPRPH